MVKFLGALFSIWIASSVFAKDIEYKVDKSLYEGFVLKGKKNAPTIFLIHDWDGLTDYEKKRTKMLHKQGYSVFSMDLYGKGIRPTKREEKIKHMVNLYDNRDIMKKRMKVAISVAKKQGLNIKNALILGYCFGGAAVLELARSGENLKGFVSFHGGLDIPEGQGYKNTKGKVVVFHGTADHAIKMSAFANLADELEKSKIPHEMITYGGAPHAFTVFGGDRYRKEADENSWARFLAIAKDLTKS